MLCREGNEPGDQKTVTYRELLQEVCKFANVLKSQGMSVLELELKFGDMGDCLSSVVRLSLLFCSVCRREKGGSGVHLHAHGSRAGGGHAGVRPNWSCAFDCGAFSSSPTSSCV